MNELAKALSEIRAMDISQNAKLTIWASLCFAKDCASGKHGLTMQDAIRNEIGTRSVKELTEWQI